MPLGRRGRPCPVCPCSLAARWRSTPAPGRDCAVAGSLGRHHAWRGHRLRGWRGLGLGLACHGLGGRQRACLAQLPGWNGRRRGGIKTKCGLLRHLDRGSIRREVRGLVPSGNRRRGGGIKPHGGLRGLVSGWNRRRGGWINTNGGLPCRLGWLEHLSVGAQHPHHRLAGSHGQHSPPGHVQSTVFRGPGLHREM